MGPKLFLNWDPTEAVQGVPHAFYAYPGTKKTCISAFPASLEAAEAPIDAPMHPLQRRIGLYAILGNSIFSIFLGWRGGWSSAFASPTNRLYRSIDYMWHTYIYHLFIIMIHSMWPHIIHMWPHTVYLV